MDLHHQRESFLLSAQVLSGFNPWIYFTLIFVGSSVAGIAVIMWKGRRIEPYRWVAAAFSCGFIGLLTCLALWKRYSEDDIMLLSFFSLFMGLAGPTALDLAIGTLRVAWKGMAKRLLGIDPEKIDSEVHINDNSLDAPHGKD